MEIQDISRADILDILFEGRNKDYGAYDLRRTYNRRLTKALAATASVCLLLIGGYTWAGKIRPSSAPLVIDDSIGLVEPPAHEPPVIPPPPAPKPPAQAAAIRSTTIRIVPDNQVDPKDIPPPNEATDQVKIGTDTHAGELTGDIVEAPSGTGVTQGVIEPPKRPEEDNSIHEFVEIESAYPAGMEAWRRFLSKNFQVPQSAIDNNTAGTVTVQFVVDKEGNVSDVKAISGPEELRAEAVRVIKKSGKWSPAIQNGRKVNSYKRQPIVVQLQND